MIWYCRRASIITAARSRRSSPPCVSGSFGAGISLYRLPPASPPISRAAQLPAPSIRDRGSEIKRAILNRLSGAWPDVSVAWCAQSARRTPSGDKNLKLLPRIDIPPTILAKDHGGRNLVSTAVIHREHVHGNIFFRQFRAIPFPFRHNFPSSAAFETRLARGAFPVSRSILVRERRVRHRERSRSGREVKEKTSVLASKLLIVAVEFFGGVEPRRSLQGRKAMHPDHLHLIMNACFAN